ncbi:MAG TPA: quinol:electron acceptor oxidoreductase subunit ActD [Blastocatellia bacterium]|nr:quinol:electron acceptor oxidoreductase subunit ActD [Blastocatellia bacterium]
MTEKLFAIFDTPAEAVRAAGMLEREGVPRCAITIMSAEPVHAELDRQPGSHIGAFAVAGGIFGATAGLLLTVLVSSHTNLNTGGMPVIAPWPFGIIVFELTALSAILATLGRMIYEARLLRHRPPQPCLDAVADGRVALEVHCKDPELARRAQSLLTHKPPPQ